MPSVDPETAKAVRLRAGDVCEYCLMPQAFKRLKFQLDHIIAQQHGGDDSMSNLALSCGHCNRHKGTNIAGIDPVTKILTRLFNPRADRWPEHFRWEGPKLVGLTTIGRATVEILAMNHPDEVAVRQELIESGRFPIVEAA